MKMKARVDTDLTVQSFAYVARQLASSPSMQYEQILSTAEKHRSALRLVLRDIFEMTEQELRKRTLTEGECQRMREAAAHTIERAQQAITRIAAQYSPHKLAA